MLDLSREAVDEWLKNVEPEKHSFIADASNEDATTIHDDEQAVAAFGEMLSEKLLAAPEKVTSYLMSESGAALLADALSYLDSARTLRLFDWLLNNGLPGGEDVIAHVVKAAKPEVRSHLKALLLETERAALSARLFSQPRLEQLQAACVHPGKETAI